MMFSAAVAFCFPMEISIFDIHADGEPDVRISGKLLASGLLGAGTAKMKYGGIAVLEHIGGHLNFDRSPVARVCDELPNCGWTCGEGRETDKIQGRNESTG